MSDMRAKVRFEANASEVRQELTRSLGSVRGFTSATRNEFSNLNRHLNSMRNALAGIGVTIGVMKQLMDSARLDKSLMQIGQTAGATKQQMQAMRGEFFSMGMETGQSIESLKNGFNSLVQSGLGLNEAKETLKGINIAMAVTEADAQALAKGLGVAASTFNFDLSKPGQALLLLDKMTVAGRLGNAELENLSDIFSRVGVNAKRAGMGFDQTLDFVEALSYAEPNTERLGTLAESTLRILTNPKYMKDAQKAMKDKYLFFDKEGARRDAVVVFNDIRKQFGKLKTDKERNDFIGNVFGETDLTTQMGLSALLGGEHLDKISRFTGKVEEAGKTLKRDMPDAISNAIDQTGRLKTTLRKAADDFAQPINDALARLLKFTLDEKKKGGLELSGKQLIAGGATAALAAAITAFYGNNLAKGFMSTGAGVMEGKLLENSLGVTPVFVVNMPGNFPSISGGEIAKKGTASKGLGAWILAGLTGKKAATVALSGEAALMATYLNRKTGFSNLTLGPYSYNVGAFLAMYHGILNSRFGNPIQNVLHINVSYDPDKNRLTTTTKGSNAEVKVTSNRGNLRAR